MSEAYWSFFLPFGEDVALLEVGAGSGERSCRMARRCGRVETLCFSARHARDVKERARAAGLDNLHPHAYRPGSVLEFPDARFDAVLIGRLLNFPAAYGGRKDPEQALDRLLRETRRVLREDGILCAGVEAGLHHRLGLSSIVSSLRKSTPLVDEDLELDLRALGEERATYRRTLSGYRQLIRTAGFSSVRAFAPLPDGVKPQVVVSLDSPEPQRFLFRQRVRRHSLKTRAAATLGALASTTNLLPRLVPFYFLVASP